MQGVGGRLRPRTRRSRLKKRATLYLQSASLDGRYLQRRNGEVSQMMHRLRLPVVALTLILALQTTGPSTLACGPFSIEAIFVFSVHPEYPLSNFARGNLGVIEPT